MENDFCYEGDPQNPIFPNDPAHSLYYEFMAYMANLEIDEFIC